MTENNIEFLNNEFSLKCLSLRHKNPEIFITSQWQKDKSQPNVTYLVYRTSHFLYLATTWILALTPTAFKFLTNWGYTMCLFQSFLAFILLFVSVLRYRYLDQENWTRNILKLYPLYWITNVTATAIGFMITIVYWIFLFKDIRLSAINFFVHGSNSILLLMDLFIVAHPVRLMHCLYPFIYGIAYTIYSGIYYVYDQNGGGEGVIYPILNWHHPGSALLTTVGVFFLLAFLHCISFGIYKIKRILHRKYLMNEIGPSSEKINI